MRRRDFVMLVGGAVTWPLAAKAQQPRNNLRRIAFLAGSSSGSGKDLVGCFTSGLRDLGWREGENITIDLRWSEGVEEKYAAFVAELASAHLDLVVVTSTPGTLAAKKAVHDIPVVFIGVSDPVKSGIVASLSRPGGNITGVSNFLPATSGKLIELLAQVAPGRTRFGVLHNPDNPGKLLELGDLQAEGKTIGIKIEPIEVRWISTFRPRCWHRRPGDRIGLPQQCQYTSCWNRPFFLSSATNLIASSVERAPNCATISTSARSTSFAIRLASPQT